MERNRRRRFWMLLLLVPLALILWRTARQADNLQDHRAPTRSAAEVNNSASPDTKPGAAQKPAPSYVPLAQPRSRGNLQEPEYILTGKVTSELGDPLPGTAVSLHSSKGWTGLEWSNPILTQTCDDDGRYTIRLREPIGAYLRVRKEGFAQKEARIDFVVPETIEMNHRLRPAPSCVEGYVFDPEGRPVPGALVSTPIGDLPSTVSRSTFSRIVATTDSSGKCTMHGIPSGKMPMWAWAANYLQSQTELDLGPVGCERADFHLALGFPVVFNVTDVRGQGIPGASTSVVGRGAVASGGAVDVRGVARLTVPPDWDSFECLVSAPNYKFKRVRIDVHAPPEEVVLEDAELPVRQVIKGRVIDETGQPVAGAKLQDWGGTAGTDKDGRFSVTVTAESLASVRVRVTKAGYITQTVTPGSDDEPVRSLDRTNSSADLSITLRHEECGIFGRVIDEAGHPITKFSLHMVASSGAAYDRGFENDEGKFSVTDVPAGSYEIDFRYVSVNVREQGSIRYLGTREIEVRRGYLYGEMVVQLAPGKSN